MLKALAILALLLVVPFLVMFLPIVIVAPVLLVFLALAAFGVFRTKPTSEERAQALKDRNRRRWYDHPSRFPDEDGNLAEVKPDWQTAAVNAAAEARRRAKAEERQRR